jgi:glycosyltransferase involved in cell wall biosynthesis
VALCGRHGAFGLFIPDTEYCAVKVALVSQFIPPFVGGIQIHIGRLAEELRNRGHNVTVIRGALSDRGPGSALSWLYSSLDDYDVVHFHGFERFLFSLVLRRRPRRLIVTPHGGIIAPARLSGFMNHAKRQIDRRICLPALQRAANRIIALNQAEADHLLQSGIGAEKITIIPNGLDLDSVPAAAPHPYLLFVGRMTALKRIDLCLRLLRLVPTVAGYFVGPCTGRIRKLYEDMAIRLGVASRVRFWGPLYGDPLRKLQRQAVANLLLSDFEHQPFSVLEAASVGTPSLVRRGCSPADWSFLGDLIRPISTMEEARTAVEHMQSFGQADRERLRCLALGALKRYSWTEVTTKIEAVYANA